MVLSLLHFRESAIMAWKWNMAEEPLHYIRSFFCACKNLVAVSIFPWLRAPLVAFRLFGFWVGMAWKWNMLEEPLHHIRSSFGAWKNSHPQTSYLDSGARMWGLVRYNMIKENTHVLPIGFCMCEQRFKNQTRTRLSQGRVLGRVTWDSVESGLVWIFFY